jgi:uncharacterized 2Fe-2S/4Fe-4S cluster protein (DUF4445 family)
MIRDAEIAVKFQPMGKTVYVLQGTRLSEAAAIAGLVLDLPCGGEGICGKCKVRVHEGTLPPTAADAATLTAAELAAGHRLACQASVYHALTAEVPEGSLPAAYHKILTATEDFAAEILEPAISKQYVELPPPNRNDDAPDLKRLERAVGRFDADLELARELPGVLRANHFRGTVVMADGASGGARRLLDFEPGDTHARAFAVAVDVGTTTLVASLLSLTTGQALEVTTRLNPQTRFGDDVLSRIAHCQQPGGLADLQQAIVEAIDGLIEQLAVQAGADRREIYEIACSGNTTMQQLLAGIDPRSLGEVPFVPAIATGLTIRAAELGLSIHKNGLAYLLPVIGGFVGGDTVSGVLATGLCDAAGPSLLVDIGTNGEIVLSANGKLTAASTAAGPAFEGARISQGMRGSTGAIEKVVVDDRLRINVIGDVPPLGICGSALIDLAAELLRHGLLSPEGRLRTPDQLPSGVLPDLAQRLGWHGKQMAFLVAAEAEAGHGRPIWLTQRDLRELQLATGAIRAGIVVLLKHAGLQPDDLQEVLVAGGFGNFIRRNNAQRIGLLPHGVPHHRIRYRGNTSLAGAQLVAISRRARRMAEELAGRTQHVDLSRDPDFSTIFAESMIYPEEES